mmetsp:Transcript_12683/g.38854  ORF Transcript_12683/g.38854 Transcript_12683/m.38854 type:complete len:212 (+) Transcript_12683:330-965(+)
MLDGDTLCAMALMCKRLNRLCRDHVWPKKAALLFRVGQIEGEPLLGWKNFYLNMCRPSSRDGGACKLYTLHELGDTDTLQGLSIRYDVNTDLICHYNAIMSDYHLRHRAQVFIPVLDDSKCQQWEKRRAELVRDSHIGREYVVVSRVVAESRKKEEEESSRQQRIRDVMVRLVSRGLRVDESEARFYLDDANMDVSLACRNLVADRKWSAD